MLFNSPEFLFCYLPLVLAGFALVGRFGRTPVIAWLGFMSLVFYGYWRVEFLGLLAGSICCNFVCARLLWSTREQPRLQKLLLVCGIGANLSVLGFFKYLFPLAQFVNDTLGLHYSVGNVTLPLGISFF